MDRLGVCGGTRQENQGASAVLLRNGEIYAAVEEERISRVKHAPGKLPETAIRFCLEQKGISIHDIAFVTSPWATYAGFTKTFSGFLKHTFGHSPPLSCSTIATAPAPTTHPASLHCTPQSLGRYASPRRHIHAN